MKIEWTDQFNTGIAEVDHDHRRLVALINELEVILAQDAELARVGGVIDDLVDYADYHFGREERMQRDMGYDQAQAHAAIHTRFGHDMGEMVGACMLNPTPETASQLNAYLRSWLLEHILVEDMKFAAYARERGTLQG